MSNIETYKGTTKLNAHIDLSKQQIELETIDSFNDTIISHSKEIINAKDNLVKTFMLNLGWLPPIDKKSANGRIR